MLKCERKNSFISRPVSAVAKDRVLGVRGYESIYGL